jgi:hypothetical protein
VFPHLFEKEKFKTPPTSMKRQTLRTSARQGKHKAFSSAKQILPPCPPAGGGVHSWLFRTAFTLHKSGRSPLEIALFLADGSSQCGRNVSRREIEEAIENSNPIAMSTKLSSRLRTSWPAVDQEKVNRICQSGCSLLELNATSPVQIGINRLETEDVIDQLFPGNPLVCSGGSTSRFNTRPREDFRGYLARLQFIVPSPMLSEFGLTQTGKKSKRCLANTGPRRFLVIEFDPLGWGTLSEENRRGFSDELHYRKAMKDQHASLLAHLAELGLLTLVVDSGGKSLHGWFYCEGEDDLTLLRFMQYAVSLGADPMTWTKCQFVRMPGGVRENGKKQGIHFFDPTTIG